MGSIPAGSTKKRKERVLFAFFYVIKLLLVLPLSRKRFCSVAQVRAIAANRAAVRLCGDVLSQIKSSGGVVGGRFSDFAPRIFCAVLSGGGILRFIRRRALRDRRSCAEWEQDRIARDKILFPCPRLSPYPLRGIRFSPAFLSQKRSFERFREDTFR